MADNTSIVHSMDEQTSTYPVTISDKQKEPTLDNHHIKTVANTDASKATETPTNLSSSVQIDNVLSADINYSLALISVRERSFVRGLVANHDDLSQTIFVC